MEEDYNIENLKHLELVVKIAFSIKQIYDGLMQLDIHQKDIKDYENRKKSLINELIVQITKESEAYEYFMDDYTRASEALDFLCEQVHDNMSEENKLIFDRINGKLSWIEMFQGTVQNPEAIYEEYFSDWERFQILLSSGLSMQEALDFHMDYYNIMDDSISFRFVSFVEEELKKNERTADFIRMKYEESFTSGNSLEDYLIKTGFAHVKKQLDDELKPNYQINPITRRKYIFSEMKDLVIELINELNNCKEGFKLGRLILLFKTYVIYFEKKDLKMLIGTVTAMVKNPDVVDLLIDYINHYEQLRASQNRDSHNHHLS